MKLCCDSLWIKSFVHMKLDRQQMRVRACNICFAWIKQQLCARNIRLQKYFDVESKALRPKMHQGMMRGGPRERRLVCGRKMHKAFHAGFKCMRSSAQTLNARGAGRHLAGLSRALRGCPLQRGRIARFVVFAGGIFEGLGTSPLSAFRHLVHLKSGRGTSCI